ncbi:hypothetical protein BC831DRAFT_82149 [Entophlyctis helioformis]|nr:hypothetical protein BC831DRAFT_82149 [Entophlyctis helioformis]
MTMTMPADAAWQPAVHSSCPDAAISPCHSAHTPSCPATLLSVDAATMAFVLESLKSLDEKYNELASFAVQLGNASNSHHVAIQILQQTLASVSLSVSLPAPVGGSSLLSDSEPLSPQQQQQQQQQTVAEQEQPTPVQDAQPVDRHHVSASARLSRKRCRSLSVSSDISSVSDDSFVGAADLTQVCRSDCHEPGLGSQSAVSSEPPQPESDQHAPSEAVHSASDTAVESSPEPRHEPASQVQRQVCPFLLKLDTKSLSMQAKSVLKRIANYMSVDAAIGSLSLADRDLLAVILRARRAREMAMVAPRGMADLPPCAADVIHAIQMRLLPAQFHSLDVTDEQTALQRQEILALTQLESDAYTSSRCGDHSAALMADADVQTWTVRQFVLIYAMIVFKTHTFASRFEHDHADLIDAVLQSSTADEPLSASAACCGSGSSGRGSSLSCHTRSRIRTRSSTSQMAGATPSASAVAVSDREAVSTNAAGSVDNQSWADDRLAVHDETISSWLHIPKESLRVVDLSAHERSLLSTTLKSTPVHVMKKITPAHAGSLPCWIGQTLETARRRLNPGSENRTAQEMREHTDEMRLLAQLRPSKYAVHRGSQALDAWMAHADIQQWTVRQVVLIYAACVLIACPCCSRRFQFSGTDWH